MEQLWHQYDDTESDDSDWEDASDIASDEESFGCEAMGTDDSDATESAQRELFLGDVSTDLGVRPLESDDEQTEQTKGK